RADKRVPADGVTAYHRRIRAERGAAADRRRPVLVFSRYVAARVHHVREHHRRTAEHVVFEDHTGVDRHVVLNLDVVADGDAGRNHDVLTDVAALADAGARHDMTEM